VPTRPDFEGSAMQAKHLMTSEVVTAASDMPTREIARLLDRHGVGCVPIVDSTGAPIGMVSDGDLIGRSDFDRDRRRDWWLTLYSEAPLLSANAVLGLAKLFSKLRVRERRAGEIMSSPPITVGETADIREIAALLLAHRIKRVPVVRDGKIVGIVSRTDLVRAVAAMDTTRAREARQSNFLTSWLDRLDLHFGQQDRASDDHEDVRAATEPSNGSEDETADASEFRKLVENFETELARKEEEAHLAEAKHRAEQVKELLEEHVTEERWRAILHDAHEAAARGLKELMILRFPHDLCSDGGRSINALVQDGSWPETLRGEAEELYRRWDRELKHHGFGLKASVLDFPDGIPGDIGLFLVWGEQ
jgi:CBS domain-containing protein